MALLTATICLFTVLVGIYLPEALPVVSVLAIAAPAFWLLPDSIVVAAIILVTIAGIRPLPPIFGLHIQLQYFLLPLLLIRSLLYSGRVVVLNDRWRALILGSVVLIVAGALAVFHDAFAAPGILPTAIADYAKWLESFVLLAVLAMDLQRNGETAGRQLYTSIIIVISLYAVFTLITSLQQTGSIASLSSARLGFGDQGPNRTGTIAAIGIVMSLAPLVCRPLRARDFLALIPCVPMLVLTGSRESLLACAFGVVLLLAHIRSGWRFVVRAYALITACVLLALALMFTPLANLIPHSLQRNTFYPASLPYTHLFGLDIPRSLAERIYFWATGLSIFLAHPLLGIGYSVPLHIPNSILGLVVPDVPVAQNAFITMLATQGLIGFACLLLFLVVIFRVAGAAARALRHDASRYYLTVGIKVSIIVVLAVSLWGEAFYYDSTISLVVVCLLAIAASLPLPSPQAEPL